MKRPLPKYAQVRCKKISKGIQDLRLSSLSLLILLTSALLL